MTAGEKRLTLVPLTAEQLGWYADDPPRLARALGCVHLGVQPDFFRTILRKQADRILAHPESLIWLTFWLMIDAHESAIVGSIDTKDVPDATGTVEIGYGVDEPYRGRGYATEAVRLMVERVFATSKVARIVAETEDGNPASDRVLTKAGFRSYDKKGISNWYEIRRFP